jgi:Xaa-Pro aminopeptidase
VFPFRASSHFLYFTGVPLENAAIRLESGKLELFIDEGTPESALWHGETPSRAEIAEQIGADAAYPLAMLKSRTEEAATVAVQDAATRLQQSHWISRMLSPANQSQGIDLELVRAIATLRLTHDQAALAENASVCRHHRSSASGRNSRNCHRHNRS